MKISFFKKITKCSLIPMLLTLVIVARREFITDDYITFINIGQGDCTLISVGGKNILIDVGGNYSNTIGENVITPYLKYEGIREIEYIFISHDDIDHSGSLQKIKSNFSIKNVIRDNNWKEINFKAFNIKQLNSRTSGTDNDMSQVILFEYYNSSHLFLGDVSKDVEEEIANSIENKVDTIKVSHHGSSSSTSLKAYKKFNPTYSIISYGKNNFGHPHNEVLETLKQINTIQFHTFSHGAIKYNLRTKKITTSNVL